MLKDSKFFNNGKRILGWVRIINGGYLHIMYKRIYKSESKECIHANVIVHIMICIAVSRHKVTYLSMTNVNIIEPHNSVQKNLFLSLCVKSYF